MILVDTSLGSTTCTVVNLPGVAVATDDEALQFMSRHRLHGRGFGYIGVHLLASVSLSGGTKLWTRDQRLRSVAAALGCEHGETAQ